ncbi:MAG TPA: protein kinase [Edaphobacter sp.]|nr:protein kinase [Edaphobacter sp.]
MLEGQAISHYKVLERLGTGATGVVCKAEDLLLHRLVALKSLTPAMLADPTQKHSLLLEARAACVLDHPNICSIHHIEELPDGQIILVMGYYEGETLADKIDRGPLDLAVASELTSQLLSGLHHAHEHGIIHRDIKPSNLMISPRDQLKIVDFGLAKRPNVAQALTETGVIVGTVSYMAPEQVLGKQVDHRTDLWACGVVFYEMLSGKLPFRGDTTYAVFDAIIKSDAPSILEHRPELPVAIHDILERALAKAPAQRFQSAGEFITALQSFSNKPYDSIRSISLGRLFVDQQHLGSSEASVLVLPFTSAEPNGEADYFCDGLTDEIITDLSSVRSLRIICRTSAMRLKGTTDSSQKIARDLNVRYVLEGSVRLNNKTLTGNNSIRVTAQLVDPESHSLLWAQKYTGALDDVFAIQENISHQIVSSLKIQLSPAEDKQMLERPLPDPDAYRYYLMAKHEILNYSRPALDRALEYIEKGEALVGKNVLLLSAKGQVYWQYVNAGISSDPEYLVKAKACADEAFRLDPKSPHAFRLLGLISVQEGEAQKAIKLLKRAIVADPNDSDTLAWYSAICGLSGKAVAAKPIARRILEIDPLTPVYRFVPGLLSLMAGEFSEALPSFDEAIQLDPDNVMLLWCRGQVLALIGRNSEAIAQFQAIQKLHPDQFFSNLGALMQAAIAGDADAATLIATNELKQIAGCDPHYSWAMAQCYSLLDDGAAAIQWLETAMDRGFINFPMISSLDPLLDKARKAPGFPELLNRIETRWETFEI